MADSTTRTGRPRTFDEDEIVERALEVFWRRGAANTTTRVLEDELGLNQSSIYNAFGSKQGLLNVALDRYVARLDAEVLAPLDVVDAGVPELLDFVDALVAWVSGPERTGCMMLNLVGERAASDPALVTRARDYRDRLRAAFGGALSTLDEDRSAARSEVLLAAVLGINISAYGGADPTEISLLADGLRRQISDWASGG